MRAVGLTISGVTSSRWHIFYASRIVMSGFFDELKRRKVYRVAIAYIVASWALAQGLAQVLPVFEISNSAIRVVIVLLLIGFPVALVLAWVFDMTPEGIKV